MSLNSLNSLLPTARGSAGGQYYADFFAFQVVGVYEIYYNYFPGGPRRRARRRVSE